MSGLEVQAITKAFQPGVLVLSEVSFSQKVGETVAVLGPSGCGKSTLLSIIAGLLEADSGTVRWNDKDLRGVPPHKRGFGLMFQDYALFPHMNVFDNVAFGLQMSRESKAAIQARVAETLELVGLPGFGDRDVNPLSGGEQQRVALARSLAPQPKLLMLDEPLGSLDRALRERLLLDLQDILARSGQTTLYVTHDQEEAYALADRIVIMQAGRIAQVGTPQEIYRHPASVFVARFLGFANLLNGPVEAVDGRRVVQTAAGPLPIEGDPRDDDLEGEVTVLLRPDAVTLGGDGKCQLEGRVLESTFRGSTTRLVIAVGETQLNFELPSNAETPAAGESVCVSFDPQRAVQTLQD
jgi:ABC-type Fe3+/spermidine/putrescine transport system ATPase subunit